ncbi:TPA: hypothetical protein ACGO2G_000280 [Streptococcus suis]
MAVSNKNLILYRNELKNLKLPMYKVIGIVSELILSKQVFRKNSEIEAFILEVFNLKLKSYLYKSRTLLVARMTREIVNQEISGKQIKMLYNFVVVKIDENQLTEKNQLDGWI